MLAKLLTKIIPIILLLSYQARHKEVERCMLEALKPASSKYLYLTDLKMLTTAALEFQLLPQEVQLSLRQCYKDLENGTCGEKFKTGKYEDCGIFLVPKCEAGYSRVDCTMCAKDCPEGSLPDAEGALCQKPKVFNRNQYIDKHDCINHHEECDVYKKFAVTKCPKNFLPLGIFMCAYECPSDFTDDGTYCVPPTVIRNDYCMNSFHEKAGSLTQASQ